MDATNEHLATTDASTMVNCGPKYFADCAVRMAARTGGEKLPDTAGGAFIIEAISHPAGAAHGTHRKCRTSSTSSNHLKRHVVTGYTEGSVPRMRLRRSCVIRTRFLRSPRFDSGKTRVIFRLMFLLAY